MSPQFFKSETIAISLLFAWIPTNPIRSALYAENETVSRSQFEVNFDSTPNGLYSLKKMNLDWPTLDWAHGLQRAEIVSSGAKVKSNRILRVHYPKGAVGPQKGGLQFVAPLVPSEEYNLSYDFRLSDDFDFRLGGKLPGLTSGKGKYTGGNKPLDGQGWSARFMWREAGEMVLYLYHVGMKGEWGDDYPLNMSYLKPGVWYHLRQHIRLNSAGMKNAKIQVWINEDLVLDLKNIELRKGQLGKIDTFYFSTFFGGNTPDWGPLHDCSIDFDNIKIGP